MTPAELDALAITPPAPVHFDHPMLQTGVDLKPPSFVAMAKIDTTQHAEAVAAQYFAAVLVQPDGSPMYDAATWMEHLPKLPLVLKVDLYVKVMEFLGLPL